MKRISSLIALFLSASVWATPARVMIIRHAEKPLESSIHLSPVGYQRAEALKNLFAIHPEYAVPHMPDELFAAQYTEGEHSMRAIETLTPLANSLNKTLITTWSADDSEAFGNELLNNPSYDGHVILIAWKHSEIANVAKGLGAPCKSSWSSQVFDRVWLIDFKDGKVTCKDVPESVMPNDSATEPSPEPAPVS
ncbi:MAG: histidine phosphatase family protein [Pseudobdellovibrio sp.]